MKFAKPNFKVEELEQLIGFVNANSPLPQQSVDKTLNQLDHHSKATCLEISENLTTLRGLDIPRYVDWVDHRLYDINSYGYQMEIQTQTGLAEVMKEIGLKKDPLPPSEKYPLSHIIDENMTPEEKKERLDFSQKMISRYLKKINEVADYLTQHHKMAKEVEVMAQDKEEYISTKLERRHQKLYFEMFRVLQGEKEFDLSEEENEEALSWIQNFYVNQKTEIDNNFYELSAEITGPYLAQMHKLFSEQLLDLRMRKEKFPLRQSLQMMIIAQLENLCRQVENLQEQQAKSPYQEDRDQLMLNAGSFARFLLLERTEMLSSMKEGEGKEELDIEKTISFLLGIDEARVGRYMNRLKKPITSWRKKHQRILKRVEEYMERLSGMTDYDYGQNVEM